MKMHSRSRRACFLMVTVVVTALALSYATPAPCQDIVWEQTNGPYGGYVWLLLATPEGVLYAGTASGVFRSEDGGDSWASANTGLTSHGVSSLTVSGTTLYAASWGEGVFRSEDGGDSWASANTGLTSPSVSSLTVSSTTVYAGTWGGGVFRSNDGGSSWTPANTGLTSTYISELAVSGATLFAGTGDAAGVFRSDDGGSTWTAVNNGLVDDLGFIHQLVVSDTTVYVGTASGVFRSEDGGDSWASANTGLTSPSDDFIHVSSLTVSGTTLYAAIWGEGVFRSEDGGDSWTAVNTGLTSAHVEALAVSGTMVYAGTGGAGVFRSEDGGDSWTAASDGLGYLDVASLAISGTALYAGTWQAGVFRSEDGGDSWVAVNAGLTNPTGVSLAVSGTIVYAGTDSDGVFRSEDGGDSWTAVNNGLASPLLGDGAPYIHVRALAASGGTIYAGTWDGVFRSEDGGDSWTATNTELMNHNFTSLVVSGTTLFAGTYDAGLFRSENGGDSWTAVHNGLTSNRIGVLTVSGTTLFAGTYGDGVFRSYDGGASWTAVNNGLTNRDILEVAVWRTTLYAMTSEGAVFRSEDEGDTWATANEAPTITYPSSLAVTGTALYAGTWDGVFRADLPIPPSTHRVDYVLPAGVSLFSAPLWPNVFTDGVHDVDVTQTGGLVMASHLVQVGATVVVGMEEGKWHAVVGQGGTVTAGYDFPIEGGKGCAINMLTPTAITMEGTPRGFPIETAAAPASGPGPVWAFVVAGEVADAALLPDGTGLRVLNTRSGEHVDAPVEMNGAFLAALINDQQRPVVMEGDVLRFEFVTPKGHLFSRVAEQRVTRTDLRRAFTRVAASARPESNRLLPNYPNPFNPETWIPFELREAAQVTITIYDAAGSVLRTLDLGHQTPGMYTTPERAAYWNGRNEDGEIVGSGVYFVEMVAGDYRQIRRIGLLK